MKTLLNWFITIDSLSFSWKCNSFWRMINLKECCKAQYVPFKNWFQRNYFVLPKIFFCKKVSGDWLTWLTCNKPVYCCLSLCSRNFQNVKLRLDFVEIWSFYHHSDFTWNQILADSNSPKMSSLAISETLNLEFW